MSKWDELQELAERYWKNKWRLEDLNRTIALHKTMVHEDMIHSECISLLQKHVDRIYKEQAEIERQSSAIENEINL